MLKCGAGIGDHKGTDVKLTTVVLIVVIGAGAVYVYERMKDRAPAPAPATTPLPRPTQNAAQYDAPWGQQPVAARPSAAAGPGYRCDGRTHCSQMRSCAEAAYFLRNCPNTAMDGDGDGVPCERQWCN